MQLEVNNNLTEDLDEGIAVAVNWLGGAEVGVGEDGLNKYYSISCFVFHTIHAGRLLLAKYLLS